MQIYTYPTTIMFLDDDELFLKTIARNLAISDHFHITTYADDKKAMRALHKLDQQLTPRYLEEDISIENSVMLFKLMVSKIKDEYRDAKKYKQISVLVIDNDMPKIKGLDFIKQLKTELPELNIFIILLTGTVGEEAAIDAFNEEIIDSYITKSDPDMWNQLTGEIIRGQNKYFAKPSDELKTLIRVSGKDSLLFYPAARKFYDKIFSDLNMLESYLIDEQGSYLIKSKDGELHTILVTSEESINSQITEIEEFGSNNITETILREIRDRKVMYYQHIPDTSSARKATFKLENKVPGVDKFMYRIYNSDVLRLIS